MGTSARTLVDESHVDQLMPCRCPYCTRPVLMVVLDGHAVYLETHEIECPRLLCPVCTTRTGHPKGRVTNDDRPCERCNNTRVVGVRYPANAIAVNAEGVARHWVDTMKRGRGEALYTPHACVHQLIDPRY